MKIKLLSLMAGPDGVFKAGTVREVSEVEGKGLVAGGYAIEISKPAEVAPEIKAKPAPESENKIAPEPKKGKRSK